ncbi:MAG TPA: hypothetical protein VF432_08575 [Thermoanaerobaculia bacterium]
MKKPWGATRGRLLPLFFQFSIFNFQFFFPFGFPTTGLGRGGTLAADDAGSPSFGSERERENAPLADRCFPTFGLRIAPW